MVITVVSDGDRCLLGQSRGRLVQMRRYSALAGFMDQGESIEEAVAREVMEEAGIRVGAVHYHSSQPWPFPSSLMIGCHADAATTEIAFDDEEMADVRWFEREEVLLALEEKSDVLAIPGSMAIAYHLIRVLGLSARRGDQGNRILISGKRELNARQLPVIPALSRNPEPFSTSYVSSHQPSWIPAFAGTTAWGNRSTPMKIISEAI